MSESKSVNEKAESCICYCIQAWGAALPNPEVPSGPSVIAGWFRTQTETETGDIVWTATVTEKTYNCATKAIISSQNLPNIGLSKNGYTKTRTRTRTLVLRTRTVFGVSITYFVWAWGAWTIWTLVNGPANHERDSLAFPSPSLLPWCGDENVACP